MTPTKEPLFLTDIRQVCDGDLSQTDAYVRWLRGWLTLEVVVERAAMLADAPHSVYAGYEW